MNCYFYPEFLRLKSLNMDKYGCVGTSHTSWKHQKSCTCFSVKGITSIQHDDDYNTNWESFSWSSQWFFDTHRTLCPIIHENKRVVSPARVSNPIRLARRTRGGLTGQSTTTLQDFKFQGTKTRDGVVFANDHSIFFNQNYRWLCRSVTELWT
mgnify:CR=1 FL=1